MRGKKLFHLICSVILILGIGLVVILLTSPLLFTNPPHMKVINCFLCHFKAEPEKDNEPLKEKVEVKEKYNKTALMDALLSK